MRRGVWAAAVLVVCGVGVALGLLLSGPTSSGSPAPGRSTDPLACQLFKDMYAKACHLSAGARENQRQCALPLAQRTGGWICPDISRSPSHHS